MRGWDDPRMPTLSGIRRRGYTPEAIRNFCASIGVSKTNGTIELGLLEHFVREDLNKRALRVMAVLRPLQGRDRQLSRRARSRRWRRSTIPRTRPPGTRKVPFSQGPVHRAGRFPRGPAEAVFPALAGPRGAAALRLLHHLHGRGEERRGRSRRGPLHLRSGDARRQRARTAAR